MHHFPLDSLMTKEMQVMLHWAVYTTRQAVSLCLGVYKPLGTITRHITAHWPLYASLVLR